MTKQNKITDAFNKAINTKVINTLDINVSKYQKAKIKEVKKIKTKTLDNILNDINLYQKIDYMNIDVEGHEEKILNGFNIKKYQPRVISIEYLDLKMKELHFKNNDINNLLNSNLYKFFVNNNYYFVNWLHGDLIFIHESFRD